MDGNRSRLKAVLSVRTVLGKVQKLTKEEHHRMKPNKGYDSVRVSPSELRVNDSGD